MAGISNGVAKKKKCFIIGVAGGTASGKTTVCRCIIENLGENDKETCSRRVVIVSQDSFYKPLTEEQILLANKGMYNFDHPNAFDTDLMMKKLSQIRKGEDMVELPIYDFVSHSRSAETYSVYPTDIVLMEGILVLYYKELRDLMDMKLFVDTDSDTRLSRRVVRDIETRGRQLENVLQQYTTFVKPAFEEFCLPTKKHADVIIPRGGENTVAINLIVQHIIDLLSGVEMFKSSNSIKTTTLH